MPPEEGLLIRRLLVACSDVLAVEGFARLIPDGVIDLNVAGCDSPRSSGFGEIWASGPGTPLDSPGIRTRSPNL